MRNCISCGERLLTDDRFCPHCGADQYSVPKTGTPAPEVPTAVQPYDPYRGMAYPQPVVYNIPTYGYPQMPYGGGLTIIYGQYPQPAYQYPYGQPYPYPQPTYGQPAYGQPASVQPASEPQTQCSVYTAPEPDFEVKRQKEEQERAFLAAESRFTGGAIARFFVNWLVGFVSLITLGFAFPAMECWRERWTCRHTVINGRELRFDGRGGKLFGKYILWAFLSVITIGIYAIFCAPLNMKRWKAKYTHFAGSDEKVESRFDGRIWGLFGVRLLTSFVTLITLSLAHYWATCYRNRWYAKHTIIDNYRLKFDGKGYQLFGKYVLWAFLSIITIGIYAFWFKNNVVKWKTKHTHAASFVPPVEKDVRK